jgi:hypothetical protein
LFDLDQDVADAASLSYRKDYFLHGADAASEQVVMVSAM